MSIHGLYLVTDRDLCLGRPLEDVVLAAVQAGVGVVQLREKQASTRFFLDEAQRIQQLLAPYSVPLIINDRLDVAMAVGAAGVHIGQDDMPYPHARRLLGPDAIIGLSVETMEQVEEAQAYDLTYLGVSPIFATPTKTDTRGCWGLEGLAEVRRVSRHRLVAIGGLHEGNAESVVRAGADGVAVVSAICSAPDPYRAAAALTNAIQKGRSARG